MDEDLSLFKEAFTIITYPQIAVLSLPLWIMFSAQPPQTTRHVIEEHEFNSKNIPSTFQHVYTVSEVSANTLHKIYCEVTVNLHKKPTDYTMNNTNILSSFILLKCL